MPVPMTVDGVATDAKFLGERIQACAPGFEQLNSPSLRMLADPTFRTPDKPSRSAV